MIVKKRVPVAAANPTDAAILEMKVQREKLQKATTKYSNLADRMKAAAIEAMKAPENPAHPEKAKANALMLIRRSREYEKQIEQCSNTLLNVETSLSALEDGLIQLQVMKALEGGAKALDRINAQLSRADEVMDHLREALQQSREISDILASPLDSDGALAMVEDDEELEAELMKMMGKTVAKSAAVVAATTTTTTTKTVDQVVVPKHEIPVQLVVPSHELPAPNVAEVKQDEQQLVAA